MLSFLKNHPFAVEAYFDSSLVLSFAVPAAELAPLLPACLVPDTFKNTWGFIAMAMVQTRHLRPRGLPKFLGNDFFLTGYRIFVRYTNNAGKTLRGLYILKSETDNKKMEVLGNMFTHYQFTTTDTSVTHISDHIIISSVKSEYDIEVADNGESASLPDNSPFKNWKEARRFAGPLPFTFSYDDNKKEMLVIEGVRQNWTPAPVQVVRYHIPFLHTLGFKNIRAANAFIIRNIPYYWKKGKIEKWKGPGNHSRG